MRQGQVLQIPERQLRLSTGMHIKEYAQFVATVNGFLDLWFDQGTPYIRGEEHVVLGTPVIMEHQTSGL